jgi:hypothetical protein
MPEYSINRDPIASGKAHVEQALQAGATDVARATEKPASGSAR